MGTKGISFFALHVHAVKCSEHVMMKREAVKWKLRGRAETTGSFVPTRIFMDCCPESGTS